MCCKLADGFRHLGVHIRANHDDGAENGYVERDEAEPQGDGTGGKSGVWVVVVVVVVVIVVGVVQ